MTASGVQAPVELFRALAVLAEPPGPTHADVVDALELGQAPDGAAYADAFLFRFYPYGSVYLDAVGMVGGEARERIAGFWRAVGRTPPPEPDHVSALLGLYAALLDEAAEAPPAQAALARQGAAALLHEHLSPWLFAYLDRMATAATGFYQAWATLAAAVLTHEMVAAGVPECLPAHLQAAPVLPDPRREEATGFVAALLAPVRTGMIVTRGDLGALGRTLGLGLRVGERRFMMDHLLAQDLPGVLAGLAELAAAAGEGHATRRPLLGVVADFWTERACGTSALLRALAEEGGKALAAAEDVAVAGMLRPNLR